MGVAAVPEETLNEAISLSVVQDQLTALNRETIPVVRDTIESLLIHSRRVAIPQLVHLLFLAAEYRHRLVPLLCSLVEELVAIDRSLEPEWKRHFLQSFLQSPALHHFRCFFLRQLMLSAVLSPVEIVSQIRLVLNNRPSNPERLFGSFCWFAPEIEALDPPLFQLIFGSMLRNRRQGMINPMFSNFFGLYDLLRADGWQIYHECTKFGFNPDHFALIISRDDLQSLTADQQFDASYRLPDCVFDCTHILDSKPSLLQVAAFFGAVQCFEFLIAAGTDTQTPAQRGLTLADFAVAGGNSELIERVLDLSVDVGGVFATAAKFHRSAAFDFLIENCDVIYESPYQVGFVAAAESNNLSLLLKCIDQGIDVNMRDPVSKTALSTAAQFGHTDILKFLLSHPEIDANVVSGYHDLTILDWAISGDDTAAVKIILGCQKCAQPDSKDWIKVAIARGNVEVLQMLLETQALRIDEEFEDRLRPLHMAVADESVPAVRLFLGWPGVDVNAIDTDGRTPLHYAAVSGYVSIARLLVEQPGIDLSVEDGEHGTPLNLAIEWGQHEIEELLRENGAVACRHHHYQVEVPQAVPVPKPKPKPDLP